MMKNILYEDLRSAMKTKDISKKLSKIRLIRKYIRELELSVRNNGEATDSDSEIDDEMLKIIQKLVKQGKDAASKYEADRRLDLHNEKMC